MRVIQISDLHLGPAADPNPAKASANTLAWDRAQRLGERLRQLPDPDQLVIVITGDLTDDGHHHPDEFTPVNHWLDRLPGTVYTLPGNHDVGNFVSSPDTPRVSTPYLDQWENHLGRDRFVHTADGHRLIGINSMILGSGLDEEAQQLDWLDQHLAEARRANEGVWLFSHAPLFLRQPDETQGDRERYWCPPAAARDSLLERLRSLRGFNGMAHGHIHRRFKLHLPESDEFYISCPAVAGTHVEADYFLTDSQVHRHDLPTWNFETGRWSFDWESSGLDPEPGSEIKF